MLTIDGSRGEGGGQVLRTALGLSLVTERPFRIEHIRAGRSRPGLKRQHLTAVRAAAELGDARVSDADVGASSLVFEPGDLRAGAHEFTIGTAGSTTLLLQALLPALLVAPGDATLELEGGTHNPGGPPFEFLERSFLPVLARMGGRVTARLLRPGFHPAGGGRIAVTVSPAPLRPLELLERGAPTVRRARAAVAHLPDHIARRELDAVRRELGWSDDELLAERWDTSVGPGNVCLLELGFEHVTEVCTGFGRVGRRAEAVAAHAAREARDYLASDAPVGPHLADQLLVPMALAGGGHIRTLVPTGHTRTNAEIIRCFLDVDIDIHEDRPGDWSITVTGQQPA